LILYLLCYRDPCTSLGIWKGIIVAAFGNGQLCLYTTAGKLASTVNAHARWINAIDIAKESGMVWHIIYHMIIIIYIAYSSEKIVI
jgi:hypothetical protein